VVLRVRADRRGLPGDRIVDEERNALIKFLGKPVSGVADRATHNRAGMEETLRRLKAAAEA